MHYYVAVLAFFLFFAGCVTVDEEGKIIENVNPKTSGDKVMKIWSLQEISPGPRWMEREKAVPLLLVPRIQELPDEFILKDLPEVANQGRQASSTAFAAGYLAMSYFIRNAGKSNDYVCSPSFLYNLLNSGKDEGIEIIDTLMLLKETGCPEFNAFPYIENDYRLQPSPEVIKEAENFKIPDFARVDPSDFYQIASLIFQKKVVVATIYITENFLTLKEMRYIPKGRLAGKHTIGIVGFNKKKEELFFQNSAGEKWGRKGYAWIPYTWFERLVISSYVILDQKRNM